MARPLSELASARRRSHVGSVFTQSSGLNDVMVGFARRATDSMEADMRRISLAAVATLALVWCAAGVTPQAQATGPYKVIKTQKVGGNGSFDYVTADPVGRRLYVARRADQPSGQPA